MAEIKVQERRGGLGWLWALIALVVIALILWYLLGSDREATGPAADTIGMHLQLRAPTAELEPLFLA
ncbi:MAG TPA: hypothetical protein VJ803_10300 [Gemmatimonadaceae bacterium]|nr:hypothetical protein [Gemmatimonadaceae bacterium]